MNIKIKKLYVKFEKPRTIRQFIKLFFSCNDTLAYTGIATYYDKECIKLQCKQCKYRSFDDIYILVKTYYPSCTVKKLIYYLASTVIDDNYFYGMYCHGINKIVCCYYKKGCFSTYNDKKGEGQYSWKQLFEKIDVKNLKYG